MFGSYIPLEIEGDIEDYQSSLNSLESKIDGMIFDYNEFQLWEAKGVTLRASITSLFVSNIEPQIDLVQSLIEDREEELSDIKTNALRALTAHLKISEEVEAGWIELSFDEFEEEKLVYSNIFQIEYKSTVADINERRNEIQSIKSTKSRCIQFTLIVQTIGTLLISFSKDKDDLRARDDYEREK